jgi:nitroreductase
MPHQPVAFGKYNGGMIMKNLIHARRTIRKFDQKPLTKEQLLRYVDAARVAPSGANLQPLKYALVYTRDMTEKVFPLVKWAAYLAPDYNPKEHERPTGYVVVCADTDIRKNGYDMDVGAAVENLILCALADGVGACWMASVDREAVRELLRIPQNLEISCVVALGYPAESPEEVAVTEGNIRYYLSENGTLQVPKRSLEDVLL